MMSSEMFAAWSKRCSERGYVSASEFEREWSQSHTQQMHLCPVSGDGQNATNPNALERGGVDSLLSRSDAATTNALVRQQQKTLICPVGRNRGKPWAVLTNADLKDDLAFFRRGFKNREIAERVITEIEEELRSRDDR